MSFSSSPGNNFPTQIQLSLPPTSFAIPPFSVAIFPVGKSYYLNPATDPSITFPVFNVLINQMTLESIIADDGCVVGMNPCDSSKPPTLNPFPRLGLAAQLFGPFPETLGRTQTTLIPQPPYYGLSGTVLPLRLAFFIDCSGNVGVTNVKMGALRSTLLMAVDNAL